MSSSPRRASTSRPSMVTLTVSGPGATEMRYRWSEGHWLICTAFGVVTTSRPRPSRRHPDLRGVAPLRVALHALPDLVREVVAQADHRRHRARPERADRRLPGRPAEARRDVVAEAQQEIEVLRAALPVHHAVQDLLDPPAALAARCALAARLVG